MQAADLTADLSHANLARIVDEDGQPFESVGQCDLLLCDLLTPHQAAALKVLWSSLSERGERYSGGPGQNPKGTPLKNAPSKVRYVLDRVGDAIEEKTGKESLRDSELVFR